jgi:hypothetical protein
LYKLGRNCSRSGHYDGLLGCLPDNRGFLVYLLKRRISLVMVWRKLDRFVFSGEVFMHRQRGFYNMQHGTRLRILNGRGFLVYKTRNILTAVTGRLIRMLVDSWPFLRRQLLASSQTINRAKGQLPATGGT